MNAVKKDFHISVNHWTVELCEECVTQAEWKSWVKNHGNTIIARGHLRTLKCTPIGGGMYKITKESLRE